jgi:hypothetical protein
MMERCDRGCMSWPSLRHAERISRRFIVWDPSCVPQVISEGVSLLHRLASDPAVAGSLAPSIPVLAALLQAHVAVRELVVDVVECLTAIARAAPTATLPAAQSAAPLVLVALDLHAAAAPEVGSRPTH